MNKNNREKSKQKSASLQRSINLANLLQDQQGKK